MSVNAPATREEFKEKVLRQLGKPVIDINVADEQVEDCIEESLKYFYDYHYDGSEHTYYSYTLNATDVANRWIPMPDKFIGAVKVYTMKLQTYTMFAANMWNGGYQMALDFAYNSSTGSVANYYINAMNSELLTQVLIGQVPIRYNRLNDKLYIDYSWAMLLEGDIVVIDGYMRTDPDENPQIWNDRWLLRYCAAKVKRIWGSNLSKFEGMQLPGGVTMNGGKIYDDAIRELDQLEQEMLISYSIPPRDAIA